MRAVVLFASLISLAALAAPQGDVIRRAKLAVADELKDPESARFRNVFAMRGSVCGEVNAKNGYGGYVGFKRFIALAGRSVFIDSNDSTTFDALYDLSCLKNPPKPAPKPAPAPYHEKIWDDAPKQ